jgi:hypothetical protein
MEVFTTPPPSPPVAVLIALRTPPLALSSPISMATTSTSTRSFPFPHPNLTHIVGKPTASTLKQLRKEVYANARSVHSERGGGQNGCLALAKPNLISKCSAPPPTKYTSSPNWRIVPFCPSANSVMPATASSSILRPFTSLTLTTVSSNRQSQPPVTGLWHISVGPTQHFANAIGDPTAADVVAFAHFTLFLPALSTLEIALQKGYLTNFPGLTAKPLRRHPPKSIPMMKGHMDAINPGRGVGNDFDTVDSENPVNMEPMSSVRLVQGHDRIKFPVSWIQDTGTP